MDYYIRETSRVIILRREPSTTPTQRVVAVSRRRAEKKLPPAWSTQENWASRPIAYRVRPWDDLLLLHAQSDQQKKDITLGRDFSCLGQSSWFDHITSAGQVSVDVELEDYLSNKRFLTAAIDSLLPIPKLQNPLQLLLTGFRPVPQLMQEDRTLRQQSSDTPHSFAVSSDSVELPACACKDSGVGDGFHHSCVHPKVVRVPAKERESEGLDDHLSSIQSKYPQHAAKWLNGKKSGSTKSDAQVLRDDDRKTVEKALADTIQNRIRVNVKHQTDKSRDVTFLPGQHPDVVEVFSTHLISSSSSTSSASSSTSSRLCSGRKWLLRGKWYNDIYPVFQLHRKESQRLLAGGATGADHDGDLNILEPDSVDVGVMRTEICRGKLYEYVEGFLGGVCDQPSPRSEYLEFDDDGDEAEEFFVVTNFGIKKVLSASALCAADAVDLNPKVGQVGPVGSSNSTHLVLVDQCVHDSRSAFYTHSEYDSERFSCL